MASPLFLALCCALVAISTSAPVNTPPARWCVSSYPEKAKCEALKAQLQEHNYQPGIECVVAENKYDCMIKIEERTADVSCYWSMDTYIAGKYHNLVPFLVEKHLKVPEWVYAYYAIAVIRKDDDSIHSLEDLRGKKSCHTGVNRHVGWVYPTAQFVQRGFFNQSGDCINNVANMAQFFSKSCASNANLPVFHPDKKYENICELCGGEGDNFCSGNDPYAGYTGALKCLVDGRGDVAFIKDTTFAETVKERAELADKKDDYRILCLDGSRKTLDEYKECTWGRIPERVCVTSPSVPSEQVEAIQDMMISAQDDASINLFDSQSYGGKYLMFGDNTKQLAKVGEYNTYDKFLGDYMTVRLNQNVCPVPPARWSTISNEEQRKCLSMRDAFAARFIKPEIECFRFTDTADAMKKIELKQADLITLDGGDIYKGGKDNKLQVIMNEDRGSGHAKYYAVAVVKKSNADINFNNLEGKKSCHTGIGRTAGWNVPVGRLLDAGHIKMPSDCNIAEAVGKFFSGSCAPGALTPAYNPTGSNPASLCELCAGVGDAKCSRTENEPFYGYTGAFRCMATGAGDVAFVKHTTPIDNTDGRNQEEWAKELHSQDFELLCVDGTRQPITEYKECNLAKSPAHGVATSGEKTNAEIGQYLFALQLGSNYFSDNPAFQLFKSGPGAKDLLFTDSTTNLQVVPTEERPYDKYLGPITKVFDHIGPGSCQATPSQ